MAIIQPIIDLVEICSLHGVEHAILCPGSRSAAITMAFVRNPKIKCYSISDERSAGFMAIGMALQSKKPVVIVCTSGSAVYNFSPAVAEAYFQQIPIIVISADRPLEWIHQNDGQTIYQNEIFGKNCKKSYNLLADFNHIDTNWYYQRTVNEAINISVVKPKGPVHLNVPIREPFYPLVNEVFEPSENIQFIQYSKNENILNSVELQTLVNEFSKFDKILIAVGQKEANHELDELLKLIQLKYNIPVIGDVIANLKIVKVTNQDLFLGADNELFKPNLLITLGKSFISKAFKKYFQKHKAQTHWHINEGVNIIDPLQSITKIINCNPVYFFTEILQRAKNDTDRFDFNDKFQIENSEAEARKSHYFNNNRVFSELFAYKTVIDNLPANICLHLANSMAVRYTNIIGLNNVRNIEIFANRGTSGIDGCLSTAVGAAMLTNDLVYLFIGDVAFFYDRNAFWNNYLPKNLRIIIFNNGGGGIFRLIDGPSSQPELEEFFETKQNWSAKATVQEAYFDYFSASNLKEINECIQEFNSLLGSSKCLEIFTEGKVNQAEFATFLKEVKSNK